ncbi:MAG TPA: DUF711 family protein [Candidatus Acidoferrales bacterium]
MRRRPNAVAGHVAFCAAILTFLCAASFFTASPIASQHSKTPKQPAPQETATQTQPPPETSAPAKPKIRTITAFIRLDPALYPQQITDTLDFLHKAKASYEQAGYEVQTLRIATQPFPEYTRGLNDVEVFKFLRTLDHLAESQDFLISVGPAMQKPGDNAGWAALLANTLAPATHMSGSVVIAGDDGIHWDAIQASALVMKFLSVHSPKSIANFNFAALAYVPAGTPFFPAAFNAGDGHQFAVGLQSANVIADALSTTKDPAAAENAIIEKLGAFAKNIEATSQTIADQTKWQYEGIDLSPAPLKRDSIGAAIEAFNGAWLGSSGSLSTAALITRALQSIPVKRAGYSGLMLPVMEDAVIARRWSDGSLTMDTLLSYSAVCGTGLDVIPLPGRVKDEQLVRIIGDVASLAVKWHKPLSARLLPIATKDAGDRTDFDDPKLINVLLRPLP